MGIVAPPARAPKQSQWSGEGCQSLVAGWSSTPSFRYSPCPARHLVDTSEVVDHHETRKESAVRGTRLCQGETGNGNLRFTLNVLCHFADAV